MHQCSCSQCERLGRNTLKIDSPPRTLSRSLQSHPAWALSRQTNQSPHLIIEYAAEELEKASDRAA